MPEISITINATELKVKAISKVTIEVWFPGNESSQAQFALWATQEWHSPTRAIKVSIVADSSGHAETYMANRQMKLQRFFSCYI